VPCCTQVLKCQCRGTNCTESNLIRLYYYYYCCCCCCCHHIHYHHDNDHHHHLCFSTLYLKATTSFFLSGICAQCKVLKMGQKLLLKLHYSDSYFACYSFVRTQGQWHFYSAKDVCRVTGRVAHFEMLHNKLFKFSRNDTPQTVSHHLIVVSFDILLLNTTYTTVWIFILLYQVVLLYYTSIFIHTHQVQAYARDKQL
jgi:hypothetical protein